ncbi:MAG: ABC transporter substrate-binding protein, partial [Bacillota bacterium]
MSKKLVSILVTLLVAAMVLAGCSSGTNTAPNATPTAKEQKIVIGFQMGPKNLDPRLARDVATHNTVNLIFDSLFRLDKNMQPQPWLVDSVKTEGDKKYVLSLKKGVKFSNGDELTANDVKFTLDTIMDPKLASPASSDLKDVKEIKVIDNYTISIELNKPYNRFLGSLSFGIVPEKVVKEKGDKFGTEPVGSGAYKLTSFKLDESMTLTANDNWFKGKPNMKTVEVKIIPENTTRLTSLESGQIDMVLDGILPADLPRLEGNKNLTVGKGISTDYEYVGFNLKVAPFKDNVKLRQAIAYALDKEAITKNSLGYRTYTSLPPNNWAYTDKVNHYDMNLETAKKLLTEAGYPNGLKIDLKTSQGRADNAQIVKEQLKKIGIDVNVQLLESATFLDDTKKGNMVMFLHGWSGQTDPDQYTIFHSTQLAPAGANRIG